MYTTNNQLLSKFFCAHLLTLSSKVSLDYTNTMKYGTGLQQIHTVSKNIQVLKQKL